MTRLLSTLFLTTLFFIASLIALVALASPSLQADNGDYHPPHLNHGHWGHHHVHTPNIRTLDRLSDRLEQIAEHLHQDAHQLSQDYHHSGSIEHYVDSLERLQRHIHEVLHHAAEAGHHHVAVGHVRSDLMQVKHLVNGLYGELRHQSFDGARPRDYQLMSHMRTIIQHDAFPLIRAMETELDGHRGYHSQRRTSYYRPAPRRGIQLGGFRINF